ncbi:MAG TPA: helix-hairpin-helix domain-containing protein [Ignavibacteriales bacterium]|nr:helix-hairpin-helix domain-containing protein [Ignavibacteriales bacterium]
MQFRKTANHLGFTRTEFIVLTALTGIFLAGLLLKYSFSESPAPYRDFDYSASDSMFLASDSTLKEEEILRDLSPETGSPGRKKVLETSGENVSFRKKVLAGENSININSSEAADLMKLPGIGEKTAGKIVELRRLKGRFNSIEELLEVKGIGPAKLNKIRKYIFIK